MEDEHGPTNDKVLDQISGCATKTLLTKCKVKPKLIKVNKGALDPICT